MSSIDVLAIVDTHYYGKDYIKSKLIWGLEGIYIKLLEIHYIDLYEDNVFDVQRVYIEQEGVYADMTLPMNRKDDIFGPIKIELGFNSLDLLKSGIIECIELNKPLPSTNISDDDSDEQSLDQPLDDPKPIKPKRWWKFW